MGQYYLIVNTEKKEYLHPHDLGAGLKNWELIAGGVGGLIAYLCSQSSGRGGGDPSISYQEYTDEDGETDWDARERDIEDTYPNWGRWANNRIVVVGDYDDSDLYQKAQESSEYENISHQVIDEYNKFIEIDEKKLG